MNTINQEKFKIGDRVIITEIGLDYGKMCFVVDAPEKDISLPVRIRLVNPNDHFKVGNDVFAKIEEKWMRQNLIRLHITKGDGND